MKAPNIGMIKIFKEDERVFNSNGIVAILPTKLIEQKENSLNGWKIKAEIPIDYDEYIKEGLIAYIKTKSKGGQPFVINNITRTHKLITFEAEHFVFQARNYILDDVRPTTMSAVGALNYVNDRTDVASPFTMTSDVANTGTAYFIRKTLMEALETIEARWGGQYDVDALNINLKQTIGVDRGYNIRYGVNLEGVRVFEDWSQVVTKLLPVGFNGILLPEKYVESAIDYGKPYTKVVNFETQLEADENGKYDEADLIDELRDNALEFLQTNQVPKMSYEVKSDINQEMNIGDIIEVIHPIVRINTEVIAYDYDVLTEKITKLTFGNYVRSVKGKVDAIKDDIEKVFERTSNIEVIVNGQTNLINTMSKLGHVYIDDNQILILDALPKNIAQNVWRWNLGGLAFSETGVEGPYKQAWTMDGTFNTDFIAANSIMTNQLSADTGSALDISSNTAITNLVQDVDGLNDNYTQLTQTLEGFEFTIFNTDGTNLLRNSLKFNENQFWKSNEKEPGTDTPLYPTLVGTVGTSNNWSLGQQSLNAITAPTGNGKDEQVIEINNSEVHSIGFSWNKQTAAGSIKVYYIDAGNRVDAKVITDIGTGKFEMTKDDFISNQITLGIEFVGISTTQPAYIANLMFARGIHFKWTTHSNEIYSINVIIDESGIKVKSTSGNAYTTMTPNEFAHYYNNVKVLSFNQYDTMVQDLIVKGTVLELEGGIKFVNLKNPNAPENDKVILVNMRGGN